ncbi:MAG: chemotaxis protein CheW [Kiloniellales bacterium]|nr:chemotaxis protein CheW [Kiloniellales bacterium]
MSRSEDFVSFSIAGQLFGIPVLKVQDVLASYKISRIPLAPPEIMGQLNLRGRVVTAIDIRRRIGLPPRDGKDKSMSIVVDNDNELYSLIVDSVGEVLSLDSTAFEASPPTLDPSFRTYAVGVYRLDQGLLVLLDVACLLSFGGIAVAAA